MNWLKRLFGKRTSSAAQTTPTPAAETPAATEPAKTEAAESAKVDAELTEAPATADEPAEAAEKPAEPEDEPPAGPAINTLDDAVARQEAPSAEDATEDAAAEKPAEPTDGKADADAALAKAAEATAEAKKAAEEADLATDGDPAPEEPAAAQEPTADESGPFGPGSAKPLADGGAPGDEFTVKGKRSSKLFHTAESPYFGRTKADVWFKSAEDATRAGFNAWNHKRATAKS
ncbi:MAG: hypothetical protein GEV28_24450 [Actinophytocola sp.]|uniref:sunset domain-containing protein n=1 Tax=Actinophytocola sp. TaxID=1872138 RepID=UPI001326EF3A|nr:hypothetical protein [Actinophytocola sp.]MPZ83372.1 hypothetical protein [Actinophytocola sp.]